MGKSMSGILDQFEQFLVLFENLKTIAGEPSRLAAFYSESAAIRDAAESLAEYALQLEYDTKWFGPKRFNSVISGFEQAWDEYQDRWAPAVAYGSFHERLKKNYSEMPFSAPYTPELGRGLMFKPRKQEEPNPKVDDLFDPARHDGGLALALGLDHLRSEVHDAEVVARKCKIALDAMDYATSTIGVDLNDVFRRWREVQAVFIPSSVSNADDRGGGSLSDLWDNAVRAYVCGAPAAAIVMCRAVLELVLKTHYLAADPRLAEDSDGREPGLKKIIALAESRYAVLGKLRLSDLKSAGDTILHKYHRRERLSSTEDGVILEYLKTIKTVIQQVEA